MSDVIISVHDVVVVTCIAATVSAIVITSMWLPLK
jgi:hypothetical protein